MGEAYPELAQQQSIIEKLLRIEEEQFGRTLDRGMILLEDMLTNLDGDTISGDDVFKLYDTYGFPLDLTQLMARERDLTVDEVGFNSAMTDQKKRAKKAGKFKVESDTLEWEIVSEGPDSKFLGYETLASKSQISRYANQGKYILLLSIKPI